MKGEDASGIKRTRTSRAKARERAMASSNPTPASRAMARRSTTMPRPTELTPASTVRSMWAASESSEAACSAAFQEPVFMSDEQTVTMRS